MQKGLTKEEYIEDFNNNILHIFNFNGVSRFKSVRRAIRRGKVDMFTGIIYPARPFNNRKDSPGRSFNKTKKEIYGRLTKRTVGL